MSTYSKEIAAIGPYSLQQRYTTIVDNWSRVVPDRRNDQEPFYIDGITLEMERKTIQWAVVKRTTGAYPVAYNFTDCQTFPASNGKDAAEFFRKCVNEGE